MIALTCNDDLALPSFLGTINPPAPLAAGVLRGPTIPRVRGEDDEKSDSDADGEDPDELDEPEPVHDVPAVDDFDDADFDDEFDDDFEEAFDEELLDGGQAGSADDDGDSELDEEFG